MHFVKILLGLSVAVQVYYLYEFVYSIPMRRETNTSIPHSKLLRGDTLIDRSREKHTRKHQQQPRLKQTTNGNNTALIYRLATSLGAVYQS